MKLRYVGVPGRQLKSPVTMSGSSLPLYSLNSASLRRTSSLPSLRAGALTWSRWVFRCRKVRPVCCDAKSAQLAERTTLVPQLAEYLCGVLLSQKPPESSTSRRAGSKKIALKLWGGLLAYLGPSMWAYPCSLCRYIFRFPLWNSWKPIKSGAQRSMVSTFAEARLAQAFGLPLSRDEPLMLKLITRIRYASNPNPSPNSLPTAPRLYPAK